MYVNASGKTVYAEDISCIVETRSSQGSIFIGNLEAAENLNTLKKFQIKALLTAAKGIEISHPKCDVPLVLYVPAEDHDAYDISKYFNQAVNYIHECLKKTNILVHCLAGVSRSVSLVLAYLIKHKQMTYEQAYQAVKCKRKIIHPNDGFISQLKKFQRQCQTSPSRCYQEFSQSPTKNIVDNQKYSQIKNKVLFQQEFATTNLLKQRKFNPSYESYEDYKKTQAQEPICKKAASNTMLCGETNPEFLQKSKYQLTSDYNRFDLKNYSPTKYSTLVEEDKFESRLRRLSANNYEKEQSPIKYQSKRNYNQYSTNFQLRRNRIASDYSNPLENIYNNALNTATNTSTNSSHDIDRKIEEIRKKYQEYSKNSCSNIYSKYRPETAIEGQPELKKQSNSYGNDGSERENHYSLLKSSQSTAHSMKLKKLASMPQYYQ